MRVLVTVVYETTIFATVEVEVDNTHTNTIEAALTDALLADADWRISDGNVVRARDVSLMEDSIEILDRAPTLALPIVIVLDRAGAQPGERATDFVGRFASADIASAFLSLSATIDPDRLNAGDYGIDEMEPGDFCADEPVIFTSTNSDSPGPVEAVILYELDDTQRDAEVGRMYHIRLPDGSETDAFADELQPVATELPEGIDL